MKNKVEYVQALRALADKLEGLSEEQALQALGDRWTKTYPIFDQFHMDKESLTQAIRTLGGKWTKTLIGRDEDTYAFFKFISDRYPLYLSISRDKVCKKTVTFDCEPMFKPEEEKELEVELAQAD